MKIAFVITSLGVGGAQRVVVTLADAMAGLGHEVIIAYLLGEPHLRPSTRGIRLMGLGMSSTTDLPRAYVRLRAILTAFRPDVVHSHMVHANLLTRLLRITLRIPLLINTAHSPNEGGRFRMLLYRLTDRLADVFTNVGHEAVAAFVEKKAVPPGRMLAVHNGICTATYTFSREDRERLRQKLGIPEGHRLIFSAGRLSEEKDYPNLIKAIAHMGSGPVPYIVCIAGEGPLHQSLSNTIEQLSLSGRIRLIGLRKDIPALLSAADVFVISSAWEGLPLIVAEAMACERVVVGTDSGGTRELMGNSPFLVPPQQSGPLADALTRALSLSPEESASVGKAARQRICRFFSLDTSVQKWLQLYSAGHQRGQQPEGAEIRRVADQHTTRVEE